MPTRHLVFTIATVVAWAGLLLWAPRADADTADDIRQVIEGQLEAFQRDDGTAAFSYASPSIQQKFRSAETFMQMVQSGYPQVYRPRAVEFEELNLEGDRAVQRLFFVGPDGGGSLALYFMERQPGGGWKIDGVQIQRLPDTSA